MPANQSQLDIDRHEVLYFCGQIRLPLAVGTMGGVLKSNPVYKANFTLMGNPNSQELAAVSRGGREEGGM